MTRFTIATGILCIFSTSCMDQYDPKPHWKQIKKERQVANRVLEELQDDGSLPEPKEAEEELVGIDKKYDQLCASCHGANGKADGPAAMAMNPKPRDLTDKAWQDSVTDDHLTKLLVGGGTAVGLSATMPAWKGILSEVEIGEMVEKIKSFAK